MELKALKALGKTRESKACTRLRKIRRDSAICVKRMGLPSAVTTTTATVTVTGVTGPEAAMLFRWPKAFRIRDSEMETYKLVKQVIGGETMWGVKCSRTGRLVVSQASYEYAMRRLRELSAG
jgi:hypothetical protein